MNLSRFIFISLFLIMGSTILFSQSEFLQRGENGFGGGFGISTNKEASGFNLFAGYSYHGFIDGKLTYSKSNGGKIQGGVLTPNVTYYFFKQEDAESVPTLGVSLGYSHYKYKETNTFIVPDTNTITWRSYQKVEESTINAILLGVTAQKQIGYWKAFFFQPIFGAGLSIKNDGWEFTVRGGVAIGTRIVRGPLLIVTPNLERQSGLTTFSLHIGVVL